MILKRVLIYDGDKDWINISIENSLCHKGVYTTPKGKIYEADLTIIEEEKDDQKGNIS